MGTKGGQPGLQTRSDPWLAFGVAIAVVTIVGVAQFDRTRGLVFRHDGNEVKTWLATHGLAREDAAPERKLETAA